MGNTTEEYIKLLGANIKQIRTKLNLTQQELAYKCEIEKSNLIRIEAGRTNPTVKTLKLIADNLGTNVSELFSFEKEN